jgi:L-ribulose-5-phosphate 3-epimerase
MNNRGNIGIRLESLGLPLRRALQEAARLGVTGVQVDAVGDLAPQRLTETGRREFLRLLRAHSLELTALHCPLRRGLDTPQDLEPRIEHIQKVLALSYELGPRRVLVEAGRIPDIVADPRLPMMTEALLALGHYGDRVGAVLALMTGLEPGQVLAEFLNKLDTGGLGVHLDPASLLLNGFDLYESMRALHGKIVHAAARDARQSGTSRAVQEVPLGHGDIDWLYLLGVCEEIAYHGWLVVTRESGDRRAADIGEGVGFLRRLVG